MYVAVRVKKTYNSRGMSVIVCTDLSGKEPLSQVGAGMMVALGSPTGVMVSTVSPECKRCGFGCHSTCNTSSFHHPHDNYSNENS